MVERANDGFAIIQEGIVKYLNPRLAEMWGGIAEEVIGTPFADYVHPDERSKVVGHDKQHMMDKEVPQIYATTLMHKDGSTFYAELNTGIITYQGKPADLVIVRDITSRKLADTRIGFLAEVLRTTPLSAIAVNEEGKIIYVNPAAEKLFGYSSEELLGKESGIFNAEPDAEEIQKYISDAVKQRGFWTGEILNRKKNGELFYVSTSFYQLRDKEGNSIASLGFQQDIIDRKKAEGALWESEETARVLMNAPLDVAHLIDREGNLLAVNEATAKRFGKRVEDLIGSCVYDLFPPELAQSRRAMVEEVIRTAKLVHFEDAREGKIFDNYVYPVCDPVGKVARLAIFSRDITERKREEEQLAQIVEGSSIPTFVINNEHKISHWNAALESLTGLKREEMVWTDKQWRAFYAEKRPVMADLIVDDVSTSTLNDWYGDKYKKSPFVEGAYEASDFFPALGNGGKWLLFTAAPLRDPEGTIIGSLETLQDITERKTAEEALRKSEERYRALVESTEDSVYLVDRDCRYLFMNEKHLSRIGFSRDRVIGSAYGKCHSKEDTEEFAKLVEEVFENGESVQHEHISHRGDSRYFLRTLSPVKDPEGRVTAVTVVSKDINERKQMENALQEREKEHQTVLDTVPVGIYHIDHEGRFVHVNKALAERYGMKPDDFKGKTSIELFSEEGREYSKSDKEVLERGIPQTGVARKIKPFDEERWVRLDKVPLKDPNGNIIGLIGFELDITERIKTQEELRNAHKQLQDIIEFLPDATFVIDKDRKVIAWNRATEEMTGIQKGDIIGKGDYEYALPFYGERRPILADLVFLQDTEIESRYVQVDKMGNTRFAEIYSPFIYGGKGAYLWGIATPLFDRDGNVVGAIESVRDISEYKQVEAERELLLKELEAKNREMERFIYTVSHDLRSPLVTVKGFAEMLHDDLERNERENVEVDLKFIENAATRMGNLLSDTLQLARIGRIANPPEDVPFGDIVSDALEQTAGDLNAHTIEVSVAEDFPTVHVDRVRIVEVLVNFITNSIKYRGDQPHPKIEIGYRVADNETVFFVKDNGMGIDESQHEKVFELFYRVNTGGEGTGAGLAIVKRIIEVHNGRIWIESEKGKGTTVCFTLPVSP